MLKQFADEFLGETLSLHPRHQNLLEDCDFGPTLEGETTSRTPEIASLDDVKFMYIKNIEIVGFRGFGKSQKIELGIPNGKFGSGLTIIVGPNNSGKSTIIEAFNAISREKAYSFPEGKRNKNAGDAISIKVKNTSNETKELCTIDGEGGKAAWKENNIVEPISKIFVVPSRRYFKPFFGEGEITRDEFSSSKGTRNVYVSNQGNPTLRPSSLIGFEQRLFEIQENKIRFNEILNNILDPLPNWTIEMSDRDDWYLKFSYGDITHNSEGLGEGLISLFILVDALYDSKEGDVIVIDEPELSLHPQLQKKLIKLMGKYSQSRQVIIATHSPYFINWKSISNGAKITKLVKDIDGDIEVYQMAKKTVDSIEGLVNDLHNPHVMGLDACEIFFLEDNVVLVEGQEDVIIYNKILKDLKIELKGSFYGWGVGGADKMSIIVGLLSDLGFKKVVGILDGNKGGSKSKLEKNYPEYKFFIIKKDDVRDKTATKPSKKIDGLADHKGKIKPECEEHVRNLFSEVNSIFFPSSI
ncbi:MAG TPA: ATP-binding protein [Methanotrichaceae archaeon]|nr:ATP-binding protein [Methanotrichaceae archaeon]